MKVNIPKTPLGSCLPVYLPVGMAGRLKRGFAFCYNKLVTKVIYYTTPNGESPVDEFLNSLSPKQQAKILRIFQYIRQYGLQSILPHVKKLSGTPLWEIRILGQDNIRVIYIIPHFDTVLALHGFFKKTQKTPRKEVDISLRRFNEYKRLDR